MKPADPFMDGQLLQVMLVELEQELASVGAVAELYVVGGAAMILSGSASGRFTQDVDATIKGDVQAVLTASGRVAARHGMPPDWLNTRWTSFAPPTGPDPDTQPLVIGPALTLLIASPYTLLALKLNAGRAKDHEDISQLFAVTGITTRDELADLLIKVFGDRINAGPPEGVDLEDTLLFADGFLRLR